MARGAGPNAAANLALLAHSLVGMLVCSKLAHSPLIRPLAAVLWQERNAGFAGNRGRLLPAIAAA